MHPHIHLIVTAGGLSLDGKRWIETAPKFRHTCGGGIQNCLKILDSRFRGNDVKGSYKTFYESINIGRSMFDVHPKNIPARHKCYL